MSAVVEAVTAYGQAVREEQRIRRAKETAQADAKRLSIELGDAAERRHSLRVTLDDVLASEDD